MKSAPKNHKQAHRAPQRAARRGVSRTPHLARVVSPCHNVRRAISHRSIQSQPTLSQSSQRFSTSGFSALRQPSATLSSRAFSSTISKSYPIATPIASIHRHFHSSPPQFMAIRRAQATQTDVPSSNNSTSQQQQHDNEQSEDGDEAPADNQSEQQTAFTIRDALLIKQTTTNVIRENEEIISSLKGLASAPLNSMLKLTQLENIIGGVTLEVIQELARVGEIHLPDIGMGTIAAQNFNTLFQMLIIQNPQHGLKQAQLEQWEAIFEIAYGVEPDVTHGVRISYASALSISQEYYNAVNTDGFKKAAHELVLKHPLPENPSPMQIRLAYQLRQMDVSELIAPILQSIYAKYDYHGDEGFALMKVALEEHIAEPEIVTLLSRTQRLIYQGIDLDSDTLIETTE